MKKILSLLALIILLAACGEKDKKEILKELKKEHGILSAKIQTLEDEINNADSSSSKKVVLVTEIQPTSFQHFIDVQGLVDAEQNVAIQPQMPGLVTKVLVAEGQTVQAGQLLAELDNSIASAQLISLQPQLDLATDLFNRQKRLWEQKVGSEVQYLQAKAGKESLEKNLNVLREQIDMAQIKSPISGVVDYVSLKVGQYAAPSFDPAFRVVNMNQLKVKSQLAESYIAQVKKGDPVALYFPDAQLELTANLSHVAKVIDPMTRTFVVESKLTGNTANLRPNMVSVMKIVDYKNDAAFVIPVNLIQNAQNTQYVYIVVKENGKNIARRKTLQVGKTYNSQAEILGGLAPGDKLITTGYLDVTDGTEVSVK